MMDIRSILGAAAVAVVVPFAATAATVTMTNGGMYELNDVTVENFYRYNETFDTTIAGPVQRDFTFSNALSSGNPIVLEVSGTGNPNPVADAGADTVLGYADPGEFSLPFTDIGNGLEGTRWWYDLDNGEEVTVFVRLENIEPLYELTVVVTPTEVPVPAAGFLLLGGLGGLAMMRRRKKS